MIFEIDGRTILSEEDFHRRFLEAPGVPSYYGENLDALWDVLSFDIARPFLLYWTHAGISKQALNERFDLIVGIFKRAEKSDIESGHKDVLSIKIDY